MKFFRAFVPQVFAAEWGYLESGDVATIKSLETLFSNIVQAVTALAAVALFVMLLVGGFNFLLSGGDQKKIEAARGTITNAVIGIVVIVSAYVILRTIGVFTGLESAITTFTIPTQ